MLESCKEILELLSHCALLVASFVDILEEVRKMFESFCELLKKTDPPVRVEDLRGTKLYNLYQCLLPTFQLSVDEEVVKRGPRHSRSFQSSGSYSMT